MVNMTEQTENTPEVAPMADWQIANQRLSELARQPSAFDNVSTETETEQAAEQTQNEQVTATNNSDKPSFDIQQPKTSKEWKAAKEAFQAKMAERDAELDNLRKQYAEKPTLESIDRHPEIQTLREKAAKAEEYFQRRELEKSELFQSKHIQPIQSLETSISEKLSEYGINKTDIEKAVNATKLGTVENWLEEQPLSNIARGKLATLFDQLHDARKSRDSVLSDFRSNLPKLQQEDQARKLNQLQQATQEETMQRHSIADSFANILRDGMPEQLDDAGNIISQAIPANPFFAGEDAKLAADFVKAQLDKAAANPEQIKRLTIAALLQAKGFEKATQRVFDLEKTNKELSDKLAKFQKMQPGTPSGGVKNTQTQQADSGFFPSIKR